MKSTLFDHTENTTDEAESFVLQNTHMLLVNLDGDVYLKQGAMAAYQGDIDFKYHGGGVTRFIKKAVTGENLQLMQATGKGDLFVADNGSEVHVVNLENEQLTVSSDRLLAFESSLEWNINRIKSGVMGFVAGGLFNTTLTGSGKVALTSWGTPVVLKINQATFVDTNCVIAWSTSLKVSIHSSLKAGAMIGRGSGEAFQMAFSGEGFVVVQPGEGLSAMMMNKS
ncbi:MAG TPA: AIM24 family protein [Candidatus Saccharimonadales bacterium]|nr:AIM24 family protein [Candidatus Saccharimonadales bacterium]